MPKYNPLYRLHPYASDWFINVKIHRLWKELHPKNSLTLELIIVDDEGDRMQVSIPYWLVCDFEGYLKEGGSYVFCNMKVRSVKDEIQKLNSPWRIIFTDKTWAELSDYPIKDKLLTNTSFKKILDGKIIYKWPYVDLVGTITKMDEIRSFEKESKRNRWALENRYIKFTIRDLEGLEIDCFATGVYANELFCRYKFIPIQDNIFLLKLWKVVEFGGTYQLTNGSGISNIAMKPKSEELEDFYKKAENVGFGSTPMEKVFEVDERYLMNFDYKLDGFLHNYIEDTYGNHRVPT